MNELHPLHPLMLLTDAVEYSALMGHDINCAHTLHLFEIEEDPTGPLYWLGCGECGDTVSCSPSVYHRYRAHWAEEPDC